MDIKEQAEKTINYKRNNRGINKSSILAFMLTLVLVFFIVLPFVTKANSRTEGIRENFFYVKILNNTMPLVKATVFNEEDIAESRLSLKGSVFEFFNIDIKNPLDLVKREMAYIGVDSNTKEHKEGTINIVFNPFKLNDSTVSVEEENKLDLPNKTVTVQDPNLKKTLNKSKPEVLIYHTHTTESFRPVGKDSLDLTKSIAAVGDELTRELEENYGISVIHDKTIHDATAYTQSYQRSGVTLDKYLKQYGGDFKLIIDLHRDAVDNKNAVTTKMNGEDVAKIMFVMARKSPNYKNNLSLVNNLISTSNKLYPGFCRGIYYYESGTSYFHQNKNKNVVLIEVGAHKNTLDEAKNSAKYIARIIAEQLNGKK
ncbi:stage II sporulation protein P [uncultured Clostridium sp.]|uniref:stage II sporulation protein P n=1 Tax=uncultured Clostridium sp. TaxID=59620 RepID=UPI0028F072B9|nr:stage II sporulation protein P [uncultured Clostridium sp.]